MTFPLLRFNQGWPGPGPEGTGNIFTEAQRTKFSGFTLLNTTLTPFAALAPDGTMTAAVLRETTGSGNHRLYFQYTQAASAIDYWLSVYVRPLVPGNRRYDLEAHDSSGSNGAASDISFDVGVASVGGLSKYGSYAIPTNEQRFQVFANYWVKFSIRFTTSAQTNHELNMPYIGNNGGGFSYAGDTNHGFCLWRPRLALAVDGP